VFFEYDCYAEYMKWDEEIAQRFKVSILVVVPLLGTLVAMVLLWQRYLFASDLWLLGVFYVLTTLGVTAGYHRMLTHRSFVAHPVVRGLLTVFGVMAFEGAPLDWVATHIKHHATSDTEEDPHSPLDGFWHAHMGWLFSRRNFADPKQYAPHLFKDRVVMFVNDYELLWMFLSLFIPFAIGGWTGLLWGGAVRIFLVNHVTWSVNSVCHVFGQREFETTDESHNHWIVGLLALGEGWHNNHHAFPQSADHGLRWWQFDLSKLFIRLLEVVGLATDVKRVKPDVITQQQLNYARIQEELADLRADVAEAVSRAKGELEGRLAELRAVQYAAERRVAAEAWYQERVARLNQIQAQLRQSAHMKKRTLMAYAQEVKELVAARRKQTTLKRHLTT